MKIDTYTIVSAILNENYHHLVFMFCLAKRNNSIALGCQITELSEITNHPLCRRKHIVILPLK
jgi:hypothetical protein